MRWRSRQGWRMSQPHHMRLACATLLLGAVACDAEAYLTVEVAHGYGAFSPDELSTEVQIYEGDLHCADLEFATALWASLPPPTQLATSTNPRLSNVSRLDHKLLLAVARTSTQRVALIGCTELDAVEGTPTIRIATEPVALITTTDNTARGTANGLTALAYVSDIYDRPLAKRAVRWYGHAGVGNNFATDATPLTQGTWLLSGDAICTTTDERGRCVSRLAEPSLTGPYALSVRAAWAEQNPLPIATFATKREPLRIVAPTLDHCVAFRQSGKQAIACLEGAAVNIYEFQAGAMVRTANLTGSVLPATPRRLVSADAATTLYAIGHNGETHEVAPHAQRTVAQWTSTPAIQNVLVAVDVPTCAGQAAGVVAQVSTPLGTRVVRAPLHNNNANAAVELDATSAQAEPLVGACVQDESDAQPSPRQSVMLHTPLGTFVTFRERALVPTTVQVSELASAGYAAETEPRLLAATLGLAGPRVQELILSKVGSRYVLRERRAWPSLGVPGAILTATFDADTQRDLVWRLHEGTQLTLQVALGLDSGGWPLAATVETPFSDGELLAADVDGNGYTDLITYGTFATGTHQGQRGFGVIRMGI